MKVKDIKVTYTTGKEQTLKPGTKGFILSESGVQPMAAWSMDDAFSAMATFMLTTMNETVGDYGTYAPLFDKFDEVVSAIKKQLSSAQWAKGFALKFQQGFLWDEVMEDAKLPETDRKYKELYDKMIDYSKRATEKLKAK